MIILKPPQVVKGMLYMFLHVPYNKIFTIVHNKMF